MSNRPHYSEAEIEAALDACAREPVHIPGAIQPMGCLVSLDANMGRIRQVSANIEDLLGLSVADVLASKPREVLGDELMDLLETEPVKQDNSAYVLTATVQGERRRFHVLAYPSGDTLVLELEFLMGPDGHSLLGKMNDWLVEVERIDDIDILLNALIGRVQKWSGHERVMVYRFDEEWNGRVVAETCLPPMESFLDHHFPASDIPPQVRRLYDMNRVRSIPDALAQAISLVPPCGFGDTVPLDMSRGVLRAVNPSHQAYLTNMGVGSSLSIAMHEKGNLWGLVACHSSKPRALGADLRDALCALVQVAMKRLIVLRTEADTRLLYGLHSSIEILSDESGILLGLDGMIQRHSAQWLELLDADGIALVSGNRISGLGTLPAEENLVAMANWLSRQQHNGSPWHTQALKESALAPWQEGDLCGLLAAALPTETKQWLMLFRREQRHSRNWAGKPEATAMMRDGRLVMTPRRSFAQWQEKIRGRSRAWRDIECRTVGGLTKGLAVLTANHEIVQLNEKLKRLAYSDGLTGVWNRYRMEQAFEAEINAAKRHDRPLAVLLFDIDHFKHFNDTYGHEAGDEVLVMLCSVMENKLRPTDNLGRWGGEEFLVLASDCNLAGGMYLAERLRKGAEELDLGRLGGVTISVGVAAWQSGEDYKALVARADQAMYQAKKGGRNQVKAEASATSAPPR